MHNFILCIYDNIKYSYIENLGVFIGGDLWNFRFNILKWKNVKKNPPCACARGTCNCIIAFSCTSWQRY